MCRGWTIGSKDFKKNLLGEEAERRKAEAEDQEVLLDVGHEHYDGKDLREANELKWELYLERGLVARGKDAAEISEDLKSAPWKVMLAAILKRHTSATNVWIAEQLNMGISQAVSQNVGKFLTTGGDESEASKEPIIRITE